jgi:hypothetical protein
MRRWINASVRQVAATMGHVMHIQFMAANSSEIFYTFKLAAITGEWITGQT